MARVLHYVGKMNRGGMETFIMNLYRKIDREAIQFDFAVHGDKAGDFEEEILSLGGKFHFFPHMRKNPAAYRKAWHNFWAENRNNYTAFHMHTNSLANIIALEEAAKAGIPIRIVHSHSSMANKGRLQRLNDFLHKCHQQKIPNLATHLFACSDKAAEWLFGGKEIKGLKVQQINNGVDTEKFRFNEEKRRNIRASLGLEEEHKVIGHIGSFIPVKNHSFLIEVLVKAYERDNLVRCVLVGTGPLVENIKNTVRGKGLDEVVLFLGTRDNVNELLCAMDIFVMPSLYEGLPVSLVEVQASGLPSLVSANITGDVKIRDNLHYLSIEEPCERWAERILDIVSANEREYDCKCIAEKGFDISDTARLYEKIILNRSEPLNEQAQ